jgi:hydrogenase nickel incorporation protein HypA/HybF
MHEMALAQSMVDIVSEAARAERAARVRQVRVLIGPLAHVDPRALEFGFEASSRGSLAEGATLVVERGSARAYCVPCGDTFETTARDAPCPRCESHQWLLLEGEEMRVMDLEVE